MPTRDNKALSEALAAFLAQHNAEEFFTCCLNCCHWVNEKCQLTNAVPPAHIIVNGCECWYDKELVPF